MRGIVQVTDGVGHIFDLPVNGLPEERLFPVKVPFDITAGVQVRIGMSNGEVFILPGIDLVTSTWPVADETMELALLRVHVERMLKLIENPFLVLTEPEKWIPGYTGDGGDDPTLR